MAATQARAIQRTARQSPYKMRLVIDQIRGKNVNEALALLKFSKKHAAKQIAKVLQVGRGERRAGGARRPNDVGRRGRAVHQARDRERRAEAQAVHAGGAGTRHADPQAHQPHRDRRRREGRHANGTEDAIRSASASASRSTWRSRCYADRDYAGAAQGRRAAAEVPQGAPRPRGDRRHPSSSASRARSS